MKIPFHPAAVAIFCLAAATSASAETLKARVSDIAEGAVREIMKGAPVGTELLVENSTAAMESVRGGKADIAIVAIPADITPPTDLSCVPFAFEVATLAVNDVNPLKKTDLETIAAALSSETQDGGRWQIFGLEEPWTGRSIILYLPDSSFGITLPLLRSRTLHHTPINSNAVYMTQKDNPDVLLREQQTGLMVIRGVKVPQNSHALEIAEKPGAGSFAYPPSESSVFYGDYPLRLPLYIVTRKDASKEVADAQTYLLSDSVAEKLSADGYVPVPKNERDNGE